MKKNLSYLDLSENSWWWTDDNGQEIQKNTTILCNFLASLKSVRMILLYDNIMSGNQIGQIIKVLRKNEVLEGLYLSGNKFDSTDAQE